MASSRSKGHSSRTNLVNLAGLWQLQAVSPTDHPRSRSGRQQANRACIRRAVMERRSSNCISRRRPRRQVLSTLGEGRTLRVSRSARWQSKGDRPKPKRSLDPTKRKGTSSQPTKTLNARRSTKTCRECRSRMCKSRMWLLKNRHEKKNSCCSRRWSKKSSWPSRKQSTIMTSRWETTTTETMLILEVLRVQITSMPPAMA